MATDLGLTPTGEAISEEGRRFAPTTPPMARFGSLPVSLSKSKAFIHLSTGSFDTGGNAEGLLPGKALESYQVVLDYPNGRFMIAPAGCVKHRGVEVPSPFLPASGHPRIVVTVKGKTYGMLLDTGTRVTLARQDLLETLSADHPQWPHSIGASGTADMPRGSGKEFLLRVPELTWGAFRIKNVLLVSRPNQTFSSTSFETPASIAGASGGNVLTLLEMFFDRA